MNLSQNKIKVLIVGSGPGSVMAAQTLVESGAEVVMLDVGNTDNLYSSLISGSESFVDLRKNDHHQHRYFLGDNFESVPRLEITTGAQLTPARRHIIKDIEKFSPVLSDNFNPMESLALGGLGAGWGLGVYVYSAVELKKSGLPVDEMKSAYGIIAGRIGVSCGNDDVTPYLTGGLDNVQQPLSPDNSVEMMLQKYKSKKHWFKEKGISFGLPSMAILTEDKNGRKATKYSDTDFYTDAGMSAWRPAFTVRMLNAKENFKYLKGKYVLKFSESGNKISVDTLDIKNGKREIFEADKLLLGAGALGTARIVMRSLPVDSLPLLCNPYTYMPAVNISMLGKTLNKRKTSMAQAMMIYDPDGTESDMVSVALYTYRSLLLMRLIQQSPLNIADNRVLFRWLQPAFVIAGIHHPDEYSEGRSLRLTEKKESLTGDALIVEFNISQQAKDKIQRREKLISKALRKTGVFPLKRIDPGYGSSIHYGGTLPFDNTEVLGTTRTDGRVAGTGNVYTVDGSSFKYLPAKGITFSIMANAHRIAENIAENG
jgi:choline dehydrogenase-like flavoprotein